jgi:hypothetical protein
MSAPKEQPTDSRIRMDPAIRPQHSGNPVVTTGFHASLRSLNMLCDLQGHQCGLPRNPALAWERVAFAEVFDHPDPGLRIRRFLDKGLE